MGIHGENAPAQGEVEPGEDLDDLQWLRVTYREVLDREKYLLEYLVKTLKDFDLRIKVLEEKFEKG